MKFQAKPITVEATQVTQVAQFQQFEGTQIARPGMWIATMEDGSKRIYRQDQFLDTFDPIVEKPDAVPEPVAKDTTPPEPVPYQAFGGEPIIRKGKKPAKKRAAQKGK